MQNLYNLPKDLLIKIICEQNLLDYYEKISDVERQIKKLAKKQQELIYIHHQNISKEVDDRTPREIIYPYTDKKCKKQIYEKRPGRIEKFGCDSNCIKYHVEILYIYDRTSYLGFTFKYNKLGEIEVLCRYGNSITKKQFMEDFPQLKNLYDYLHSDEFVNLLFSPYQ